MRRESRLGNTAGRLKTKSQRVSENRPRGNLGIGEGGEFYS